jgi:hypothetical protein
VRLSRADVAAASAGVLLTLVAWAEVLADPVNRVVGIRMRHWVEGVMWWYWQVANAPLLGKSPIANDLHGYPIGFRHIDVVGNLGDSVLAAPLSWAFDPPLSYNLAVLGFTLFTLLAGHACFRAWGAGPWAAIGLAVVFAFQPQLRFYLEEGRPTQIVYGWSLLALAAARPLLERGGWRWAVVVAVGWAGAFVTFWFNGAFLGLLLLGLAASRRERVAWAWALRTAALALAFSVPWGLPVLTGVSEGSNAIGFRLGEKPQPGHMSTFSARPWEFLAPDATYGMQLCWSVALGAAARAVPRLSRRDDRRAAVRLLPLGVLLLWLLSLGPRLVVDPPAMGRQQLPIELPWTWLHMYVPFWFRLSYPYMVFPYVLAGLLLWVAARVPRRVGGVLALVMAGESLLRFDPRPPVSEFQVPAIYAQVAAMDDVRALMEFPLGRGDYRHVHQAAHGKPMLDVRGDTRKMFHARGLLDLYETTPFLRRLYAWQSGEDARLTLPTGAVAGIVRLGIDALVLSRESVEADARLGRVGYAEVRVALVGVLGTPVVEDGDVAVFRLRATDAELAAVPAAPAREAIPGVSDDPLVTGAGLGSPPPPPAPPAVPGRRTLGGPSQPRGTVDPQGPASGPHGPAVPRGPAVPLRHPGPPPAAPR